MQALQLYLCRAVCALALARAYKLYSVLHDALLLMHVYNHIAALARSQVHFC
jgi:hypothetical protein